MGIMERFGRIADTYISEKEQLLGVEEERRRVHTGHAFWPTEVLRDTIIFASIVMVILELVLLRELVEQYSLP